MFWLVCLVLYLFVFLVHIFLLSQYFYVVKFLCSSSFVLHFLLVYDLLCLLLVLWRFWCCRFYVFFKVFCLAVLLLCFVDDFICFFVLFMFLDFCLSFIYCPPFLSHIFKVLLVVRKMFCYVFVFLQFISLVGLFFCCFLSYYIFVCIFLLLV